MSLSCECGILGRAPMSGSHEGPRVPSSKGREVKSPNVSLKQFSREDKGKATMGSDPTRGFSFKRKMGQPVVKGLGPDWVWT